MAAAAEPPARTIAQLHNNYICRAGLGWAGLSWAGLGRAGLAGLAGLARVGTSWRLGDCPMSDVGSD